MTLDKITNKLFLVISFILIFSLGVKWGEYSTKNSKSFRLNIIKNSQLNSQNNDKINFDLFWDVWNKIETKYVDVSKIDQKNMYYGAIKGMVMSLGDPYTYFLTPSENKRSKDDLGGKLEGIGAQLGLENNQIIIIAPLKSSPAEKAGLKSCDSIKKVDGKSTEGMKLEEVVNKIRGEKGTSVKLTLSRCSKNYETLIVRDQIMVPSIELTFKNKIAILKLTRFGDDTEKEWDRVVDTIKSQYDNKNIKGMILDMRDDPGGYLGSAVYVASEFLPKQSLVVKQQYADNTSQDYTSTRDPKLLNIPLVVLINRGSASASEIVAGALTDYKKAKLVGLKSFGKGSIQEAIDLSQGAGLHVTIAKWILPKGDWINGKGIKPDIAVKDSSYYSCSCDSTNKNDTIDHTDKQLDQAINILNR
jgi:carboxyl-terminal processing protease